MLPFRGLLNQFAKNSILLVVSAGAYFTLGLLGLAFKNQIDVIGMFMPSAGLALALTLIFGIKVLPGLFLGAFCTYAWSFDFKQSFTLLYFTSATGAVLSAFIGAQLIKRTVGYPQSLLEPRHIGIFLLLGGPLSCLISATLTSVALYSLGVIVQGDLFVSWLNAWLGNVLGVLVFTPVILIFFAELQPVWQRCRTTVCLPVMLVLALVFSLFFYIKAIEHHHQDQHSKEKTALFALALKNRLEANLYALYGLRNFLIGLQFIEPQQYLRLAKHTLAQFKEIQTISWVNMKEDRPEKNQFITFSENAVNSKPESWRTIPAEIRKKILTGSFVAETVFPVFADNNCKWIIPANYGVDENKKTLGISVAKVSMEVLIQETARILNVNSPPMTISVAQKSSSTPKVIFSNTVNSEQETFQTTPIQIAGLVWSLNFHHELNEDKADVPSFDWLLFYGLWITGLLGVVLLLLTGRHFRHEAIISERSKALLETKTAAELANQAKDQFLAKISHELRTPLNGISGFTQLLEKKPNMTGEDRKQLAIIKLCSDNLLNLINDILDISVIEAHQLKTEQRDFNFATLLSESMAVCKLKADEKGLALIIQNLCVPQVFTGDEKRIRQILVNLIDNAIKYTSEGRVAVTTSYENGMLNCSVADTGCGIAPQDLDKIFHHFVQLNSNNFANEGIGLGLSITKELVAIMNGDLTVSSQLGVGSVFSVSIPLPVSVKNQSLVAPPVGKELNTSKLQVLIVDDNEINLLFLVGLLEYVGCKVDCVREGQQALILIEETPYDLALIDINMPIMNGLELVKIIRQRQNTLKIVAVSAYADDYQIKEALEAGFDSYLTKPVEEDQLIELIKSIKQAR
ncbi:MAG: response regulator [Methyloglobulus sp.]|nr:response regulator [Methyloglobulus sp.]